MSIRDFNFLLPIDAHSMRKAEGRGHCVTACRKKSPEHNHTHEIKDAGARFMGAYVLNCGVSKGGKTTLRQRRASKESDEGSVASSPE
jgi:hypothetical protein